MRSLVVLALFGVGCVKPAESTVGSTNKVFAVEKLFTDADGFSVKRFVDKSEYHYYVTPSGEVTSSSTVSDDGGKSRHVVLESIKTLKK